jgi:hypothetical protein
MKHEFLKAMPEYKKYCYNRVRRMKRHGFDYNHQDSILNNVLGYAAFLLFLGKPKLAAIEMLKVDRILTFKEKIINKHVRLLQNFERIQKNSLYAVNKCKGDGVCKTTHASHNGEISVCGLNFDHHWFITNNSGDEIITCKKCLSIMKGRK